ncbi:HAD hydrolase family protein [Gracilibacillus alcaliphilus]|uniref:HAD hydrolase family protein n=1 Tax=Gracilibacillus alcaliphilus TaxID=1401441 RepID=UPI00195EAEE1|nr:HAD hydrolase family protein [Gracilibacillus alcaliphilus]
MINRYLIVTDLDGSLLNDEHNISEPENRSKGEALKKLIIHCHYTDMYTIGFGNNLNDITLLEEAHIGIAVKKLILI